MAHFLKKRKNWRIYGGVIVAQLTELTLTIERMGSGCGSVGGAVASNTRGPRFESRHQQKFIYIEQ